MASYMSIIAEKNESEEINNHELRAMVVSLHGFIFQLYMILHCIILLVHALRGLTILP